MRYCGVSLLNTRACGFAMGWNVKNRQRLVGHQSRCHKLWSVSTALKFGIYRFPHWFHIHHHTALSLALEWTVSRITSLIAECPKITMCSQSTRFILFDFVYLLCWSDSLYYAWTWRHGVELSGFFRFSLWSWECFENQFQNVWHVLNLFIFQVSFPRVFYWETTWYQWFGTLSHSDHNLSLSLTFCAVSAPGFAVNLLFDLKQYHQNGSKGPNSSIQKHIILKDQKSACSVPVKYRSQILHQSNSWNIGENQKWNKMDSSKWQWAFQHARNESDVLQNGCKPSPDTSATSEIRIDFL